MVILLAGPAGAARPCPSDRDTASLTFRPEHDVVVEDDDDDDDDDGRDHVGGGGTAAEAVMNSCQSSLWIDKW